MPKDTNSISIKTVWENNPDTPLTAANISRSVDAIGSYLNTSGYPNFSPNFANLHVEGAILFADPDHAYQLMLKRGTVLQVINTSTVAGIGAVPKNENYKLFDVGLDDIILTSNDADDSLQDKSSWGLGTQEWYVFICDKDDSRVYTKASTDSYGGGAQILISKHRDFPVGQVPGRPTSFYSAGDTRLIGGFKTSGSNIIASSIWDISGKFQTVKAKKYQILDEYGTDSIGLYVYRPLQVNDLDTSVTSIFAAGATFNGVVTVNGAASFNTAVAFNADINASNINASTISVSGAAATGDLTVDGSLNVVGALTVNKTTKAVVAISNVTALKIITSGGAAITGATSITGDVTQVGNATLGGTGKTIGSTGAFSHTGSFSVDGNVAVKSGATPILTLDTSTLDLAIDTNTFEVDAVSTFTGTFRQSGSKFSVVTTSDIDSSTLTRWKHVGNFIVDSGNFSVQVGAQSPIFSTSAANGTVSVLGSVAITLPSGKDFIVKDETNATIFGFAHDVSNKMVINRALDIVGNGVTVDGDSFFNGNLTVSGSILGNISIQGSASSAAKWTTARTLSLTGDVTGSASIDGSANVSISVTVSNDSHTHDTRYYTQAQLNAGQLDTRYAALVHNHDTVYAALVHNHDTAYYTKAQTDGFLATKSATTHVHAASVITYTNTFMGVAGTTVAAALDKVSAQAYTKLDTSYSFAADTSVTGNLSATGNISSQTGNVYTRLTNNAIQFSSGTYSSDLSVSYSASADHRLSFNVGSGQHKNVAVEDGVGRVPRALIADKFTSPLTLTFFHGATNIGSGIVGDGTTALTFTIPSVAASQATESTLGVVRVDDGTNDVGIILDAGGMLELVPATTTTIGGIKVGTGLTVTADGTLNNSVSAYTLPTASASSLGGIKVGTGLSISAGVLNNTVTAYTLPAATSSVLGGVKNGTGISNTGGTISVDTGLYYNRSNINNIFTALINNISSVLPDTVPNPAGGNTTAQAIAYFLAQA
jgi:hypothetical protein